MTIVDDLTPRQCKMVALLDQHATGLLRSEIAKKVGKNEKTVERILKSLPKSILRKKRDRNLNGAPFRYRTRVRKPSYTAFCEKMASIFKKPVKPVAGAVSSEEADLKSSQGRSQAPSPSGAINDHQETTKSSQESSQALFQAKA